MHTHPLKTARELRGWSQAQLAEQLGVSTRTVARWEQRQALPYPYYREQLCRLFGQNARELGLLPTSELEDKADEMEKAVVSPPSPPASLFDPTIPEALGQANRLLGRDGLLAQLKERVLAGGSLALTALQGLPGIGKTALAVALATDAELQTHFIDGVLWAGLGPQADVLGLLIRWGALLGLKASDIKEPTNWSAWHQALRGMIGPRRMLLVIDDAWEAEAALALQVGGPHCAHLLTTRLPQVAFAFAQQSTIVVPELAEGDGMALLARFVPSLVSQEQEAARELVQAVGGLPLALNLLGRYLAAQSFSGQPRRMQAALTRLQDRQQRLQMSLPTPLPERPLGLAMDEPLSLQATIALSTQQLAQGAQTALAALALFPPKPNSFSEEAALVVSTMPVETLDALWDAGLLESSGPGRYTLHQTIADYARQQPLEKEARQRLIDWVARLVEEHQQDYEVLERELANIEAGLDSARGEGVSKDTQHQQIVVQVVLHLMHFLRIRGLYVLAQRLLEEVRQYSEVQVQPEQHAKILYYLCDITVILGKYEQAEAYGQEGLQLVELAGEEATRSDLLSRLGRLAQYRGDTDRATHLYAHSLQLARQVSDPRRVRQGLLDAGQMYAILGKYAEAEAVLQEVLTLARVHADREHLCQALNRLGAVVGDQDDYVRAEAYLRQALSLAQELGSGYIEARILTNSGNLAAYQGKWEQADVFHQKALLLYRKFGDRRSACIVLTNLGATALDLRHYQQAESHLREALAIAREIGDQEILVQVLECLGNAVGWQEDYQQASVYFQECLDLAYQSGHNRVIGNALVGWGEVHLHHGQIELATHCFTEALERSGKQAGDPVMLAKTYYGLGKVAALQGDQQEARQQGQQALSILEHRGHYMSTEIEQWLQALPEPPQLEPEGLKS